MPLSSISPRRSLTSYAAVQGLIGRLVRNRGFQLRSKRVREGRYLDVGCGPNLHRELINLDFLWRPGVDVCWDIKRGLPFADASLTGVFSEHCLEHFSPEAGIAVLREIRRVLSPAGAARIVVPDGGLYLRLYHQQTSGDLTESFPFQREESAREGWTPMASVNRIFYQDRESPFGHRTIYDFAYLAIALRRAGFARIERFAYRQGTDPQMLVDDAGRAGESLYVEAFPR